jgi:signal transduction histidine kinase
VTPLAEIRACVGFGATEQGIVAEVLPVLVRDLDRIGDRVAHAIEAGDVIVGLAVTDRPRGSRLRRLLTTWIEAGLRGPHDDAFHERRSGDARLDVQLGLTPARLIAAMGVLRRELCTAVVLAITEHEPCARACEAINILVDLELAIIMRRQQVEADERQVLRERQAQAGKLLAMQTLTAGLAHEVRNPLNAAKLQLELLERRLRRSEGDPRLVESAELVHREIERLTGLLKEFLDFAQPPQLAATDHDLVAVVGGALESVQDAASARGASLELSASARSVVAAVDAAKVHQVVVQVVRNAVEAVSRGGHVAVEVAPTADGARIVVRDDGPGIPADALPRIWEPFFSTKDGGIGMGMSIAHSLVDLHHGTIEVRTSSAGTELEIRLPRHADVSPA